MQLSDVIRHIEETLGVSSHSNDDWDDGYDSAYLALLEKLKQVQADEEKTQGQEEEVA